MGLCDSGIPVGGGGGSRAEGSSGEGFEDIRTVVSTPKTTDVGFSSSSTSTGLLASAASTDAAAAAGGGGVLDAKGSAELLRIAQETIAYCSALDDSRDSISEEAYRLRTQKDNLESMLQASSNREQTNLAEVRKQRDVLAQWQERFTELKSQATVTLRELEDSRDALRAKLEKNLVDYEKCRGDLQAMERVRQQERLDYAGMQEVREKFTHLSAEKLELQREIESLRHDNFQLQNSINQLSTDKNQLLGRIDELEAEGKKVDVNVMIRRRCSQDVGGGGNESPFMRANTLKDDGSPYMELDESAVKQAFREANAEEKIEHFEKVWSKYRDEAMERIKMEQYAFALLNEFEKMESERPVKVATSHLLGGGGESLDDLQQPVVTEQEEQQPEEDHRAATTTAHVAE
eukprot:GHVS01078405.1.p1 GENE.GHVS01078405.1~~GHVS01078405.1.p1  ORF type:complete len:405 (-),score=108.84 GHVS01078405.1:424-1638(-)